MDIWHIFLQGVVILFGIFILYLIVRPEKPVWYTWHKNGRRLDFRGNGNTGTVMYFDCTENSKEYFYWHTYHVADPDSMIKAFKWLNGEDVKL